MFDSVYDGDHDGVVRIFVGLEHKDKLNSLVMDRAILIAVDFSICAEIHQAISFGDV